jgi:hypothetical protein
MPVPIVLSILTGHHCAGKATSVRFEPPVISRGGEIRNGRRQVTIRGVRAGIRENVRRTSADTGRPACEIVRKALREWAQSHPEVLAEPEPEDDLEFNTLLADVRELLAVQAVLELIDQLTHLVGSH